MQRWPPRCATGWPGLKGRCGPMSARPGTACENSYREEWHTRRGAVTQARSASDARPGRCRPGVERRPPTGPWKAPEGPRRVSPLEASTLYLKHLAEAGTHSIAGATPANRLEVQDIILTVPASFDAVARELTVEAA